jgi:hypothetical protein
MTKKEKFLMFVYLGAIASDISQNTTDCHRIALQASLVPERRIPPNPMNAAKVFLAYFRGYAVQPQKWMLVKRE